MLEQVIQSIKLNAKEVPDLYYTRKGETAGTKVVIYSEAIPQPIAAMAVDFINRWGMVAAVDDGEDSSGRHKVRLATPQELVDRAVQTAELVFQTIQDKKWVLELPTPKEPTLTNGEDK